jgi:UPF0176 protein
MSFIVATFYHFFDFPNAADMRAPLLAELKRLNIKGSLLIAPEGINGTLAGTRNAIDRYLSHLETHIVHAPFEHKESRCDRQPFARSKVRLKKEIIFMGEAVSPQRRTGQYVNASDWNRIIADPGTTVIDARNAYEIHLGSFDRAIDPQTRSFSQLPDFVRGNLTPATHKKIATFCTGGIRCEKFSAWLLDQGFEEVYQLKGGILKYLEQVPPEHSSWQGECYVFDDRIAVGHGLTPSQTASQCPACGHALTPDDRQHMQPGERCPFCVNDGSAVSR